MLTCELSPRWEIVLPMALARECTLSQICVEQLTPGGLELAS